MNIILTFWQTAVDIHYLYIRCYYFDDYSAVQKALQTGKKKRRGILAKTVRKSRGSGCYSENPTLIEPIPPSISISFVPEP